MRSIFSLSLMCLVLAACGSGNEASGALATTVTSAALPTTTVRAAATTTKETTTTSESATTATVPSEQMAAAEAVGDIAAGRRLFDRVFEELGGPVMCSTCHTLDGVDGRGPSLAGIFSSAAGRVEDLSAADLIRRSILEPQPPPPTDWPAVMPGGYREVLSDEDIDNLTAFLLTQ